MHDRDRQEMIRRANPDGKHCLDLEVNPEACDGCPMNPRDKRRIEDEERMMEIWGEQIERMFELVELVELNGSLVDELSPEEVQMMLMTRLARRSIEMDEMAKSIAYRVGELFAGGSRRNRNA